MTSQQDKVQPTDNCKYCGGGDPKCSNYVSSNHYVTQFQQDNELEDKMDKLIDKYFEVGHNPDLADDMLAFKKDIKAEALKFVLEVIRKDDDAIFQALVEETVKSVLKDIREHLKIMSKDYKITRRDVEQILNLVESEHLDV